MNRTPEDRVLGVCGFKNSGKTTLIEQLIPELLKHRLRVAIIKHDAHGIQADHPGKDSFRFYEAGADVLLRGPSEELFHCRRDRSLQEQLGELKPYYDLILVEGHKGTPIPKIWLHNGEGKPADLENVVLELTFEQDRVGPALAKALEAATVQAPVYGLVSVNPPWVEDAVLRLEAKTETVVLSGPGPLPDSLKHKIYLPEPPQAPGPGILSAMRWNPECAWLAVNDKTTDQALDWLLSQRKPGIWAVIPKALGIALYEPQMGPVMESAVQNKDFSLTSLCLHKKSISPEPPEAIIGG